MTVQFNHRGESYTAYGIYDRFENTFELVELDYMGTNIFDVIESLDLVMEFEEEILKFI